MAEDLHIHTPDLEAFSAVLKDLEPGQGARVPYDVFELLFPPGVEHDNAKEAAFNFSQKLGTKIQHRPDDSAVYFYRPE